MFAHTHTHTHTDTDTDTGDPLTSPVPQYSPRLRRWMRRARDPSELRRLPMIPATPPMHANGEGAL